MAKKNKDENKETIIVNEPNKQLITDVLETNYMPYTMSVIVSRAIPEIDGFKPSHRKLLYTMYKMGLLTGDRMKSADVTGTTMRLNPHGDGAIYETMVRLTRGAEALLHPFVDSKGTMGKVYSRDMAYAASRYTEVKLAEICTEIFKDIYKDTVDFIDNYNGTLKEPVLLPTTFPNLLVTPNQGIAVGMASTICSFNLVETCNATIEYLKNPDVDLLKHMKAPDFSTGGEILYDEKILRNIYETGRGSFKLRAKYRYDKKNSCIEVYEIPYTTTIEAIIDKTVALVKSGKIRDINDIRNETDLKGLKIAIDIKKSADPDMVMQRLFAQTPLVDSFSCNFNILINGRPQTLGVRGMIREWLIFRKESIRRKAVFELGKNKEKMHLLEGLAKILLDIDKAIRIIRETEQDKMVIPNLCEGFKIDEIQAEYVAEIKLRNLNKEYLLNRTKEIEKLKNEIGELEETLKDEKKIDKIIVSELKAVSKKFGQERKTEIVETVDEVVITEDSFIDDYNLTLFLTSQNYLKKISALSLRASGDQYLKDDEVVLQEIETTNKAEILMFSDKHNVYKIKAYEIADSKASGIGEYLNNILPSDKDERIIFMTLAGDYKGDMIFAFQNGKAAKVPMNAYETKTNRRKLINAYSNKAPLTAIFSINEDIDLLFIRDTDKASLVNSSMIPSFNSKNSGGVQILALKKNSKLSSVLKKEMFTSEDIEYYRAAKLGTTGHFIIEKDKAFNSFTSQTFL